MRTAARGDKSPVTPLVRALFGVAALFVVLALLGFREDVNASSILLLAAASLVVTAWSSKRAAAAALVNNQAWDLLTRGELERAEALLATVDAAKGSLQRTLPIQRAFLALLRGDLATVETQATLTVEMPPRLSAPHIDRTYACTARAVRALARSMLGRDADAQADIAAVRASDATTPEALARANLAACVVHSRAERALELARELASADGLSEWLMPRERALLRAIRRKRRAGRSVYREPAKAEEDVDELGRWIERAVPGAGSHAVRSPVARATDLADLSPNAASPPKGRAPLTVKQRSHLGTTVALGVLLVLGVMALALVLGFVASSSADETASSSGSSWIMPIVGGVGAYAFALFVQRRAGRTFTESLRLVAEGREDEARARLERQTRSAVLRGDAHLWLAKLSERRGEFETALEHAERGIAVSSGRLYANAQFILLPTLIGERAFALAALGRDDDARREVQHLTREFPQFVELTRVRYRVELVLAARTSLDAARNLARRRSAMLPLTLRDELLADALLATEEATSDDDARTVLGEVERNPRTLAWMGVIAPQVLAALRTKSGLGARVGRSGQGDRDDEASEAAAQDPRARSSDR